MAVCGRRCPRSTAIYQWRCVLWLRWFVCCLLFVSGFKLLALLWLRFWSLQVSQHFYRQTLFLNHMFWNFHTGLGRFYVSGIWNIEPWTPKGSTQESLLPMANTIYVHAVYSAYDMSLLKWNSQTWWLPRGSPRSPPPPPPQVGQHCDGGNTKTYPLKMSELDWLQRRVELLLLFEWVHLLRPT